MQDYTFYIITSYGVSGLLLTVYLLMVLRRFLKDRKTLNALKARNETKA